MKIGGPNAGGVLLILVAILITIYNPEQRPVIVLFACICLLPLAVAIIVNLSKR